VQQIQEDLPQEKEDNQQDPEGKKAALTRIIADYNARFGTNHRIGEFDLYYQDVQKRIKDQQFPNTDLPPGGGKDRHHHRGGHAAHRLSTPSTSTRCMWTRTSSTTGLIQAFSRTNRVLNDSKPYGNILDFRQQQKAGRRGDCALLRREDRQPARNLAGRPCAQGHRQPSDGHPETG
jgi:type I restriction enzyme R subunit